MLLEITLGLITLALVTILFLRRNYGKLEKLGVPVVPPSIWGLGSEPLKMHETNYVELDMENFRKYGKVWGSYSIAEPWLNVADADLIKVKKGKTIMYMYSVMISCLLFKAITVRNFDNFSSHYFENAQQKFKNLTEANGAEWRDLRKGLSPTFSSGKIKGMLELISGAVDNMIDHLETVTQDNPAVMVKNTFQSMALDVIAKVRKKWNTVFKIIKKLF